VRVLAGALILLAVAGPAAASTLVVREFAWDVPALMTTDALVLAFQPDTGTSLALTGNVAQIDENSTERTNGGVVAQASIASNAVSYPLTEIVARMEEAGSNVYLEVLGDNLTIAAEHLRLRADADRTLAGQNPPIGAAGAFLAGSFGDGFAVRGNFTLRVNGDSSFVVQANENTSMLRAGRTSHDPIRYRETTLAFRVTGGEIVVHAPASMDLRASEAVVRWDVAGAHHEAHVEAVDGNLPEIRIEDRETALATATTTPLRPAGWGPSGAAVSTTPVAWGPTLGSLGLLAVVGAAYGTRSLLRRRRRQVRLVLGVDACLREARLAEQTRDGEAALAWMQRAALASPHDANIRMQLAWHLAAAGRIGDAREAYETAAALAAPDDGKAHVELGIFLAKRTRDVAAAETAIVEALRREPEVLFELLMEEEHVLPLYGREAFEKAVSQAERRLDETHAVG
jgi:hypothetical protein